MKRVVSFVLVVAAAVAVGSFVQPSSPLPTSAQAGCGAFPETGKTVGGLFLKYWNEHGGIAQQGYPISEEFVEVSDLNGKPYKVQYFQRAVFEYHPENAPPYDVLLSQLGTLRYRQKYGGGPSPSPVLPAGTATATPTPANTPTPSPTTCPAFGPIALGCRPTRRNYVEITWNIAGGAGQIRGELTAEEPYSNQTFQ